MQNTEYVNHTHALKIDRESEIKWTEMRFEGNLHNNISDRWGSI